MLSPGTKVMYGKNGICNIIEIVDKKIGRESMSYYALSPVYKAGLVFYVPVAQEELFKPPMTAEETVDFIKTMPQLNPYEIADERTRRDEFSTLLTRANRQDLVRIIKTLYAIQQEKEKTGKHLCAKDEQIFAQAQKILYDEFSVALSIDPEQVVPFITQSLNLLS